MLTFKQSIIAIILITVTMGLADGEPTKGQLVAALIMLVLSVAYTVAMVYINTVTTHEHTKRNLSSRNE